MFGLGQEAGDALRLRLQPARVWGHGLNLLSLARSLESLDSIWQQHTATWFLPLHVWRQKPLMRKLLSLCLRNVMQHLSPSLPAESFTGDLTYLDLRFFPPLSVRAPTSRACCEIETLAARRVQIYIYMQKHMYVFIYLYIYVYAFLLKAWNRLSRKWMSWTALYFSLMNCWIASGSFAAAFWTLWWSRICFWCCTTVCHPKKERGSPPEFLYAARMPGIATLNNFVSRPLRSKM